MCAGGLWYTKAVMRVYVGINCRTKKECKKKLSEVDNLFGRSSFLHIDIARKGFAQTTTALDIQALKEARGESRAIAHIMDPFFLEEVFLLPAKGLFFHWQHITDWEHIIKKGIKYKKNIGMAIAIGDVIPKTIPRQIKEILVLAVPPGKSGQIFSKKTMAFIHQIKKIYPSKKIIVDGGINPTIVKQLVGEGVAGVVSASFIWNAKDRQKALRELTYAGRKK